MRKWILKSVLLVFILCVCLFLLSPVLVPKWVEGHTDNGSTYLTTTTNGFFALEENSLDVLFIGSSQILRDVSPTQLEEEYGFRSYARSTTVQPPSVSYYYLKNALKTQSPRMVVIDPSMLYTEYDADQYEEYIRFAFDWMPLDLDKLSAVYYTIRSDKNQKLLDYIFPSVYYHSRIPELTAYDFTYPFEKDKADANRGVILLDDIAPQDFVPLKGDAVTQTPYAPDSLMWYEKMIDLCKSRGILFVMIRTPRVTWTEEEHAADVAFAEKNDVPLFDFNVEALYNETGIDAQTDFYDRNHLTAAGAAKLTHCLGQILQTLDTNP